MISQEHSGDSRNMENIPGSPSEEALQRKLLWDEIRRHFPKPAQVDTGKNDYCVGGALCLVLRREGRFPFWENFPSSSALANALRIANNNISNARAIDAATAIINHNDAGRFKAAWRKLKEALHE